VPKRACTYVKILCENVLNFKPFRYFSGAFCHVWSLTALLILHSSKNDLLWKNSYRFVWVKLWQHFYFWVNCPFKWHRLYVESFTKQALLSWAKVSMAWLLSFSWSWLLEFFEKLFEASAFKAIIKRHMTASHWNISTKGLFLQ